MLVSMGEAIAFYPQKLIARLANPTEPIRYLIPEDYQARHFTFKLMYNQTNPNESLKELLRLGKAMFLQSHFISNGCTTTWALLTS